MPDNFSMLQVIEQNLIGLEQFVRRGRLERSRSTRKCSAILAGAPLRALAGLDVRA